MGRGVIRDPNPRRTKLLHSVSGVVWFVGRAIVYPSWSSSRCVRVDWTLLQAMIGDARPILWEPNYREARWPFR